MALVRAKLLDDIKGQLLSGGHLAPVQANFFWKRNFSEPAGVSVHSNFGVHLVKFVVYKSWTRFALLKGTSYAFW